MKTLLLTTLLIGCMSVGMGQSKLISATLTKYTIYNEANYGDTNQTKFNAFTIDGGIRMIKDDRRFKTKNIITIYSKQGTYKIITRYKNGKYGNSILVSQTVNKIK